MSGQEIRKVRQIARISAAELASAAGMAISTLTYIERNFIPAKPEDVKRIEIALDMLRRRHLLQIGSSLLEVGA